MFSTISTQLHSPSPQNTSVSGVNMKSTLCFHLDQSPSQSDKDTSDSSNQSSEQQLEEADNATAAATTATNPPPKSIADRPTELIPFSFHCKCIILNSPYSSSRTEIKAASTDPPNSLMANLVDFPRGGTSIFEVSSGSGESHLTISINERLAFCRRGDCELQLFYTVFTDDAKSENRNRDSGDDDDEGTEGQCRIVLTSAADAEKLYRSILMRVGRHFLRAVGLYKEREGKF